MTKVLFIATDRPLANSLDDVAAELRDHYGASARLATYAHTEHLGEMPNVEEVHKVQVQLSLLRGKPVRKYTPQWLWVVVRNPILRKRLQRADNILRPWLLAHTDPWVMKHAREADVLVALDDRAVYTVWELAQLNTKAKAVRGMYDSLEAVKRPEEPVADTVELASHGQ